MVIDFTKMSDNKLDLKTGRVFIDTVTKDAVLIYGIDVAIQNLAIRFNTQIGTVKRQELDGFGWDARSKIKQKINIDYISALSNKLVEVAFQDTFVKDATVDTADQTDPDQINFIVNVQLLDGLWYAIQVTV